MKPDETDDDDDATLAVPPSRSPCTSCSCWVRGGSWDGLGQCDVIVSPPSFPPSFLPSFLPSFPFSSPFFIHPSHPIPPSFLCLYRSCNVSILPLCYWHSSFFYSFYYSHESLNVESSSEL